MVIDPVNDDQNYHSLKDTMNKGGTLFLVCSITFGLVEMTVTNIVGTLILQPAARIFGIFAEEAFEFVHDSVEDLTTILMGPKAKTNYLENNYDQKEPITGKDYLVHDEF